MANVGDLLIVEARKHLGKPYVWATHGPNTFDCSGFTYYVTKQVQPNFVIYTGTQSQKNQGTVVPLASARPGDFVFYVDPPGSSTVVHVGLYISPTELIHAANESTGVIISNGISGSWYAERLYQVRRLFPYDDAQAPGGGGGTTPPPSGGSSYQSGDLIQVTAGPLNMRSGPGTSYGVVTSLGEGTQLCVTGTSVVAGGYEWVPVKITSSGVMGHVAKQFTGLLTAGGCAAPPPPPDPEPEPEPEPPPPAPTGYQNGDKIRVTEGVLNMRSGAGTSYGVILGLQTGTELCVTGASVDSGGYTWVPVKLSGGTTAGWVAKTFTALVAAGGCNTAPPPEPPPPPPPPTWTHKVTGSNLRLRSAASATASLIFTMPIGTRLKVNAGPTYSGGYTWYNVTCEQGYTGWCVNGFDPI